MFSTPGFYDLMGGTKVDNAAAQYGVAACLWLLFLSPLGRRAVIGAGLCGGWAVASRYTNIIFLPALMAFFTMIMAHAQGHSLSLKALRKTERLDISSSRRCSCGWRGCISDVDQKLAPGWMSSHASYRVSGHVLGRDIWSLSTKLNSC